MIYLCIILIIGGCGAIICFASVLSEAEMKVPIPIRWMNGDLVSPEDRKKIVRLREHGCRCRIPLLGSREQTGLPRCRLCCVEVKE